MNIFSDTLGLDFLPSCSRFVVVVLECLVCSFICFFAYRSIEDIILLLLKISAKETVIAAMTIYQVGTVVTLTTAITMSAFVQSFYIDASITFLTINDIETIKDGATIMRLCTVAGIFCSISIEEKITIHNICGIVGILCIMF